MAQHAANEASPTIGPVAELIGSLSDLCLGSRSRERFEQQAVAIVADLFGADGVGLLRIVPSGLLVAATRGWAEGAEGMVLDVGEDSQAAFILAAGDIVASPQLDREERFVPASIVTDAGFVSALSCRIGHPERPSGLIGVYRRTPWEPDQQAISNLRVVAGLLAVGLKRRTADPMSAPAGSSGGDEGDGDDDGSASGYGRVTRGGSRPGRTGNRPDLPGSSDPLTGLEGAAAVSAAVGSRGGDVVVLRLGLDGFHQVNERLGHDGGDTVLRVVAERLAASVRTTEAVTRVAGDEFAVVCAALDAGHATQFAERLVGRVEQAIHVSGRLVEVSASVGVAIGRPGADGETLLAAAGAAMAVAKEEGRGRVVLAARAAPTTVVRKPSLATARLVVSEAALDAALGGVHAVFQPIVRASDHLVVGLEALARGPVGTKLAMPDSLFSVAAAHGRVGDVELAVKRAAFAAAVPEEIPLFVNLDPAVLVQEGWLDRLVEFWEQLGRRRQVVVELTERSLTASPRRLLNAVERCRRLGWLIALDDIGARAESLTVLRIVRPDIVKLDMGLTADPTTPHASAVATAIASHRERGDVHVIAEGIESLTHELAASILGADYLQGFWFGRPRAVSEIEFGAGGAPGAASPLSVPAVPDVRSGRAVATKKQLLGLSRYIESLSWSADTIVLAALQHRRYYTPATRRRYVALSRQCGMVGVIGEGLGNGVVEGVKLADLAPNDRLRRSWQVVNLSMAGGVALLAEEVGPGRLAESDRLFRYRITSVAEEVEEAAIKLLTRF